MKKETYIKMTRPFREHPNMAKGLDVANKICTGIMYLAYPLLLCHMFLQKEEKLFAAVLVPALSFVLLSVFRAYCNRSRPYEAFGVPPIIKKDTKGHSFPSRHVFSAGMIAFTFCFFSPVSWLGGVFLGITLLLAIVRVLSGVHYISDVAAGIFLAAVAAAAGYLFWG